MPCANTIRHSNSLQCIGRAWSFPNDTSCERHRSRNSTHANCGCVLWPFEALNVKAPFAESGLPMKEQQTFRASSSEIRDVFGRWLAAQCTAGVRLVVLEGLMGAGKSRLTEQPFAIATGQSVNSELDGFLRKPVNHDTEYMDAMDIDAASAAIREAYRTATIVDAEGPMAWPSSQSIV